MVLDGCLTDGQRLTQVRIGRLAVQNEVSDLALAPRQLFKGDRSTKHFVDEPNAVPEFYRQLGKSPEQIIKNALDVLAMRFGLP
jgi:hypothetical protein